MPERLAPLRLALAQINPRVGDLEGNAAKISHYVERARDAGAELVLFPELALSGYPPEDLLLKEHFLRANAEALTELAAGVEGIVADRRLPGAHRGRLQLDRGDRRRRRPHHLPQDAAVELRRRRRGTLLPGRPRGGRDRPRRGPDRADRVRGHVGARRARLRGGRGRRRADRQLAPPRRTRRARACSASGCSSSGRATTSPRSRSATSSAARTSSSSTGTRW